MSKTAKKLGDALVIKELPGFVQMVQTAIENKNYMVLLHPDSLKGEPELMYAAVYYATSHDCAITFMNGHTGPHPLDKLRPVKKSAKEVDKNE